MAYLFYGIKQAEGFVIIAGDSGVGKTILLQHLMDRLRCSRTIAAYMRPAIADSAVLPAQIMSAFGVEASAYNQIGVLSALESFLVGERNRGRHMLLLVDEAQGLTPDMLETFRLLSHIDYDGEPLLQVFLIAQPEFLDMLQAPEMLQLRQRIIASYHLESLTREETFEYILHRLSIAGWNEDPVFADEAMSLIYEETLGSPARINLLCNRIMLFCAIEKSHEVTRDIVESVLAEMKEEIVQIASKNKVSDGQSTEPLLRQDSSVQSEFDRLIAPRRAAAAGDLQDRQEATLGDIASAIAAAGAEESLAPQGGDVVDVNGVNRLASQSHAGMRSLDGMRQDIKEAGDIVDALKRDTGERKTALASSFTFASQLISDIRRIANRGKR